jgi:hypothetical protein
MLIFVQILAGILSLGVASYIYWLIGQEHAIGPRWRSFPGMEVLVVSVVLGGWAAGGSLIIHGAVTLFSN